MSPSHQNPDMRSLPKDKKPASYQSFIKIWQETTPNIQFQRPRTDMCKTCEDHIKNIRIAIGRKNEEEKIKYYKEALKLDDDSALYFGHLSEIEEARGNFKKAIEFGEKSYAIDSTDYWVIYLLGCDYMHIRQYDKFLDYINTYQEIIKTQNNPHPWGTIWIGYAYWIKPSLSSA